MVEKANKLEIEALLRQVGAVQRSIPLMSKTQVTEITDYLTSRLAVVEQNSILKHDKIIAHDQK